MLMTQEQLQNRDDALTSNALPLHLLFLALEAAGKDGYDVRADVPEALNRAMRVMFEKIDPIARKRIGRRVDETAVALLRDYGEDRPLDMLYVCAQFCVMLVHEHVIADPRNQATLTGLLIMDDAEDDATDTEGNEAVVSFDPHKWGRKASRMLRGARLLGLYQTTFDYPQIKTHWQ